MKKSFISIVFMMTTMGTYAGGLLTNTNQHPAFNRMMSREASIGIDGVYYNPAGVAFMSDGHHLAINWQLAFQTRTIENDYTLFTNNVDNPTTPRTFKGNALAPVIPSFQYAYNKNRWSFQANFALTGGGGKCTFDNGLGSFEKIVAETALGACQLASGIDQVGAGVGQAMGLPIPNRFFTADDVFGTEGKYSYNSFMNGRQYYFGLSAGAAYRVSDHFSAFAGVRGVYATCNYYGYVRDIRVGGMLLYQVLDITKPESANIELSCDQSGLGFTPILAVDYKTGRWNFSAKYEFKTRMRLKNKAVNQAPSIGNLSDNLKAAYVRSGIPEQAANAILGNENIEAAMGQLKTQFDQKLTAAIGEYADGKKIAADIPAYLTLGAGYKPIDALRINVGFHWFDDKHATSYNDRQKLLDRGTIEWNAGAEYDLCKKLTVSAGWQSTNYGLSDEYMEDRSFVVNSNSVGCGAVVHFTDRMHLNVAYFHTFYQHKNVAQDVQLTAEKSISYNSDYTRNNNVFALGLDLDF